MLSQKYEIRFQMDNIWEVYLKGTYGSPEFQGTLLEVNAWIELKEKGFDI